MATDYRYAEPNDTPHGTSDDVEPLAWDTLEQSIPTRFEHCTGAFADRPAVEDASGVWTYARLNRAADRIARRLVETRGPASEPVAALFDQGAHFLAAILGVMKAGKFYVPLDPLFPQARNTYVLDDSGASLLLTDAAHAGVVGSYARQAIEVLAIEECEAGGDDPCPPVPPEARATLLYTSGSTGLPKGVLHDHRTLIHNAVRQYDLMCFSPGDRFSMVYSSSVMGTVRDYTNALLNGAELFPFDIRSEGLVRLVDFLERQRLTIFHTIPSVLRHLASVIDRPGCLPDLRFLILGGESVLRADFEIFRRAFPDDCRLFTGLGLTETGTIRQNILTHASIMTEATVPLGYPLRDVEVRLLDEAGQEVKAGQVGEIVVRSHALALEYWRKPEETRAAFTNDALEAGVRFFHTGDLGTLLPDGCLVHKGRKDHQIKVRGFRIELEEVETAILETGLAKDAVVVGRELRSGDKCLVAYLVSSPAQREGGPEIRQLLAARLPDHMIPALFIELEELPLTPNGKVDRLALPEPDFSSLAGPADLPLDDIEAALVELWKEVLSIDRTGVEDNFFDLGGNSLLASEMLLQIDRRFGRHYPPSFLIDKNTIRQLAAALRDPHSGTRRSLVAVRSAGSRPPLFVIPGGHGDILYLRLLSRYLPSDQPFYGLQGIYPGTESGTQPLIEDIASHYLQEIVAIRPHGPYLLAGHSFGGYVALELGRQLIERGERIPMLAMLDTYPPGRRRKVALWTRLLIHARNLPPMDPAAWHEYLRARREDVILRLVRNPFLARAMRRVGLLDGRPIAFSRIARHAYSPAPYPGDLVLFKASERPWFITWDPMEKWPGFVAGKYRVCNIPGRHETILFEPHVRDLAEAMTGYLDEVASAGKG